MEKKLAAIGYYPLWGASFDSEEGGLVGPRVVASYPFEEEWFRLMDFNTRSSAIMVDGAWVFDPKSLIPLCLTTLFDLPDDSSKQKAPPDRPRFDKRIDHAITAMRLHKPGWFLTPYSAQVSITAGGVVYTYPGLYRSMVPRLVDEKPFVPYELSLGDLHRRHTQSPPPLYEIYSALERLDDAPQKTGLRFALHLFNSSFAFGLSKTHRCGLLFTTLEIVVGRMSNRRDDGKSLRTSFQKRLHRALELSGVSSPGEKAAWTNSRDGGRGIRNAIAHGRLLEDTTLDQALTQLMVVVRWALRAAIGCALGLPRLQDSGVGFWREFVYLLEDLELGVESVEETSSKLHVSSWQ